jgi:hypothetical protein
LILEQRRGNSIESGEPTIRRSRDADARLAERALREAWDVPSEKRPELIAIATGEDTPPREAVSASKALLMASRINLETIRVAMAADEFDTIVARLKRLEAAGAQGTDQVD